MIKICVKIYEKMPIELAVWIIKKIKDFCHKNLKQ